MGLLRRISERGGITQSAIAKNIVQGFDQVPCFFFPRELPDLVSVALQVARELTHRDGVRLALNTEVNGIDTSRRPDQSSGNGHTSHLPSPEDIGLTVSELPNNTSDGGPSSSMPDDFIGRNETARLSTEDSWKLSAFLNVSGIQSSSKSNVGILRKNTCKQTKDDGATAVSSSDSRPEPPSVFEATATPTKTSAQTSKRDRSPSPFLASKLPKTYHSTEVETDQLQSPT